MAQNRDIRGSTLQRVAHATKAINKTPGNMWVCFYASGLVYWEGAGIPLPAAYQSLAEQFCTDLNKDLHHDGKWTVTWSDFSFQQGCYTKIVWAWFDADDDLHVLIESDEGMAAVFLSMGDRMEHCESSINEYRELMKLNDIRPKDTIKAALGQQSADPRAAPTIDLIGLD